MVAVTLVLVGVRAYDPVGQHCDTPGGYGCAVDASLNGGNAFIYECGPTDMFVYVAGCRCPTCCEVVGSGALCT
ncbi:hypothetical protein BDW22DRAFT_1338983 [Trametopsis cervina]|nr:hypothetical protein BDW22DRAFT_1338983 [Trametopsis cervina]